MIRLRTLNLEALRLHNKNHHYSLIKRLEDDRDVYKFISKRLMSWVKEPECQEGYEFGKTYIIKHLEEEIGICGSSNLKQNGITELWIAIDKEQRNKGYGEKVLVQITEYLLDYQKDLNDIQLVIKKDNVGSNKMATLSGYHIENSSGDENYYRYFGGK